MERGNFIKVEIHIPLEMTSEHAKSELANAVYQASINFFEFIGEKGRLTDGKKLQGNGHHMAQYVAEYATKMWDERLEDKK
jgi:hypothetical protein